MATDNVKLNRPGARWITKWFYDMDAFPGDSTLLDLLKALFVCAAGDGEVSKTERDFYFGYLDAVGVPESLHEFIRTYDAKDKLEDLVSNEAALNNNTKMAVIYTAMLVAGADGYAESEHAAIVKMSGRMGVSEELVNKIRAQYERDLQTRSERIKNISPDKQFWDKLDDKVAITRPGARWVTNWLFGFDVLPGDKSMMELLKAVLVCAGGDGEVSKIERDFFSGYADAVGLPESLQEFIQTYPAKDSLDDLIKGNPDLIVETIKRGIIYGAMLTSGADGYAESEHAAIVQMGAKLGVKEEDVNKIRSQYERDLNDRKDRIALLFPGEHPWKK